MTSTPKNAYIDQLDDIVNEYNNTYHRKIKMNLIGVTYITDHTYINIGKEVNDEDPKFKVGVHVRISKYKNIFAKGYTPNWSEEIFVIKEIKYTVLWTYVINDLNGEEIIGKFYEKELQTNSALTAVENKIPDVSSLAKKTDYNTKISEVERNVSDHNHTNILLLQNLIFQEQGFLLQD